MSAAPDNTVTIPTGSAISLVTAAQMDMITAQMAVDASGACVTNLCANGAPGADVTSHRAFSDEGRVLE